jgi:hypothetical protein
MGNNYYGSDYGSGSVFVYIVELLLAIFLLFCLWKLFVKANKPGWAAIVPIYNILVELEIVGRPWYWLLLMLIPVANLVVAIMLIFRMAKVFGKGTGFGFGLLLLPIIFYPILAFGDATYLGPNVE